MQYMINTTRDLRIVFILSLVRKTEGNIQTHQGRTGLRAAMANPSGTHTARRHCPLGFKTACSGAPAAALSHRQGCVTPLYPAEELGSSRAGDAAPATAQPWDHLPPPGSGYATLLLETPQSKKPGKKQTSGQDRHNTSLGLCLLWDYNGFGGPGFFVGEKGGSEN